MVASSKSANGRILYIGRIVGLRTRHCSRANHYRGAFSCCHRDISPSPVSAPMFHVDRPSGDRVCAPVHLNPLRRAVRTFSGARVKTCFQTTRSETKPPPKVATRCQPVPPRFGRPTRRFATGPFAFGHESPARLTRSAYETLIGTPSSKSLDGRERRLRWEILNWKLALDPGAITPS